MFSEACVSHSVHGGVHHRLGCTLEAEGVCTPEAEGVYTRGIPQIIERDSTPSTPRPKASSDKSMQRSVRILLECILVFYFAAREQNSKRRQIFGRRSISAEQWIMTCGCSQPRTARVIKKCF